ncbi:CvpA family protein [Acetobacter ghanensis]|uniref:Colicin V production protein n=1 Tax=Acetobacter ghanensis TaxID=431306 RepID=A0A0U5F016_9PROT|nr:CvpA family protein [Acetobacter ghanensis]NHO39737.1 CvpA family protein [Acetobacter ghanensis]GBQ49094.1 bacteriocin/colicin V production CvpA [Acetobacter ghanensis DSM 18895]CEF53427.1 Colicin V production protein [Acetobacter ghanensis]
MAAIDAISLIIVALSTLHGLWRGFTQQALGLLSWAVAILLAFRFHAVPVPWLSRFIHSPTGLQLASFALVLLFFLVAGYLLAAAIVRMVRATPLDGLDRTLGGLFGIARGACVVVLLFMAGQWLLQPEDMAAIEANGRLTPYIRAAATHIHPYLVEFDAKGVAPKRSTGHDATL